MPVIKQKKLKKRKKEREGELKETIIINTNRGDKVFRSKLKIHQEMVNKVGSERKRSLEIFFKRQTKLKHIQLAIFYD